MGKIIKAVIVLAQLTFLLSGMARAEEQPVNANRPTVLGRFPNRDTGPYELSVDPCKNDDGCPARISLLDAGQKPAQSIELPWGAYQGSVNEGVSGEIFHPLNGSKVFSWTVGSAEERVIEIFASPVRLGDLEALMVTEQGGFEHTHRAHALYAVVKGRLKQLWTADEGAGGPRASWVRVLDPSAKAAFIHFDIFYCAECEEPDRWSWATYRWNAAREQIELAPSSPGVPTIHAAIIGSYKTLAEARQAELKLDSEKSCVRYSFYALKSNGFHRLEPGWFILASFGERKQDVEAALAEAKACSPAIKGYVKRAN